MKNRKRVIVDVFGSDTPEALLRGCAACSLSEPDVELLLPGDPRRITDCLAAVPHNPECITVLPATQVIDNSDSPPEAVMTKTDSSLIVGMRTLAADPDTVGMVTAGSTGAALCGSIVHVRKLPGVIRPALAAFLPVGEDRMVTLLDCGANVDCPPALAQQFALMGHTLERTFCGVPDPRVGLLSVGSEDEKGNAFSKAVFPLLRALPIRFGGNMEAREALSGNWDVIVSDGFAGNVLLKTIEGTGAFILRRLLSEAKQIPQAHALLTAAAADMNFSARAGAMILGIRKPIVKAHGNAGEATVLNTVHQVLRLAQSGFSEALCDALLTYAPDRPTHIHA